MSRPRRSALILVRVGAFAALLSMTASPAVAQPPLEQARARFDQAEAYFKAGTYDKAIEEYRAAYALVPRPALLFNIGLCYEHLDDATHAIEHYDRFIAAEPSGSKTTEARARREALARKLEVKRTAEDVARRAADERTAGVRAAAAGDHGEAIERLTASYALLPEPEVLFELAEAYLGKGDDLLAATEYRRYLSTSASIVHRERASAQLRAIEARKSEPGAGAPVPVRRGSLKPAIVAYSVAGVTAVVGIVYGRRSRSTLGSLDDELALGTPPLDTGDPRFDEGRSAARTADIAFALAGAAAVTGAVLTWRALRKRPVRPGEAVVAPTADARSAGVRLEVVW